MELGNEKHNEKPIRIIWLGKVLHKISHIKIVFYIIALYFQVQSMIFSRNSEFIHNFNIMLLMYGIAMTFESFRDNEKVTDAERKLYLYRPKIVIILLAMLFGGGILAMGIGIIEFITLNEIDLGWGITTFALGLIALGRQQYDQYLSVLKDDIDKHK